MYSPVIDTLELLIIECTIEFGENKRLEFICNDYENVKKNSPTRLIELMMNLHTPFNADTSMFTESNPSQLRCVRNIKLIIKVFITLMGPALPGTYRILLLYAFLDYSIHTLQH